jgi:hypothetical protein
MTNQKLYTQFINSRANKWGIEIDAVMLSKQDVLTLMDMAAEEVTTRSLVNLLKQMHHEESEEIGKCWNFKSIPKREAHANNKYCIGVVQRLAEGRFEKENNQSK